MTTILENKEEAMRKFKRPSKTVINCVRTVFEAMAYEKCIREKIESIQRAMLLMVKAIDMHTGEAITEPKHSYLMSDEQFKDYWEECKHDYKDAGFTDEKYHGDDAICPLLEAESLVRDAKRALVYSLEDVTGITFDMLMYKFEEYEKYVELNLRYYSRFV